MAGSGWAGRGLFPQAVLAAQETAGGHCAWCKLVIRRGGSAMHGSVAHCLQHLPASFVPRSPHPNPTPPSPPSLGVCEDPYCTIMRMKKDGSGRETFARGGLGAAAVHAAAAVPVNAASRAGHPSGC